MNPDPLNTVRKNVHLLPQEKEAIRARILRTLPQDTRPTPTPSVFFAYPFMLRTSMATLAVFLVAGSSLTYAAQKSHPGDVLYGLEIRVIEPFEERFYSTPEAQVAYHTDRLEERLTELHAVKETKEKKASVEAVSDKIKEHVADVEHALETESAPQVRVDALVELHALVQANEDVLTDVASLPESLDSTTGDIEKQLDEAVAAQNESSDEEVLASLKEDLEETDVTVVDADIEPTVRALLEDIETEVRDGDVREAFELVTEVRVELRKQQLLEDVRE